MYYVYRRCKNVCRNKNEVWERRIISTNIFLVTIIHSFSGQKAFWLKMKSIFGLLFFGGAVVAVASSLNVDCESVLTDCSNFPPPTNYLCFICNVLTGTTNIERDIQVFFECIEKLGIGSCHDFVMRAFDVFGCITSKYVCPKPGGNVHFCLVILRVWLLTQHVTK